MPDLRSNPSKYAHEKAAPLRVTCTVLQVQPLACTTAGGRVWLLTLYFSTSKECREISLDSLRSTYDLLPLCLDWHFQMQAPWWFRVQPDTPGQVWLAEIADVMMEHPVLDATF